ncbi:MAG: tetratricopeptide repeat protein, partial [Candidatus Acidiferrales bacterium]
RSNAIRDFNSAVAVAPDYPDAWREMGRAEMFHRDYAAADTAFHKYLALQPNDHLAYLNMSWALYQEKKFSEDADLLERRIAAARDDGDAHNRLGLAYLELHQPERAVPALEQAVNLLPKYAFAQYTLGRAYLETHQNDKAASAFQRAVVLDDSDSRLNDAAYLLASHDSSLDIAEGWATRAVNVVEVELNGITLDSTQPQSSTLAGKAAMYWDTLGWIKFQKGELPVAEKYVFAALQLADDSTIAYHLGRIYEAQGHNDKAIELYSETLAIAKADTDKTDDEKDAAIRLASLLGGQALVQQRVEQSRVTEHDFRTIQIPNSAGVQGIGQYSLLIGPDSKALDIQSLIPDDALAGLTDALRATVMPQSFPDAAITKIPRIGTLVCATAAQPCTFTLLSSTAASRMLPSASQ